MGDFYDLQKEWLFWSQTRIFFNKSCNAPLVINFPTPPSPSPSPSNYQFLVLKPNRNQNNCWKVGARVLVMVFQLSPILNQLVSSKGAKNWLASKDISLQGSFSKSLVTSYYWTSITTLDNKILYLLYI